MKSPEGYEKADLDKFFKPLIASGRIWLLKPFMAGFGKSGVPDYIGCCLEQWQDHNKGLFFSIEVKREGKEPTPIQWRRMREIEQAGGKTFWGTAAKVISEFEAWIR